MVATTTSPDECMMVDAGVVRTLMKQVHSIVIIIIITIIIIIIIIIINIIIRTSVKQV